ncbi:hypothetical protein [Roseomonas chloroacetimidivorans]|uniref:hypothetical protein n=1 Tax=Roseomonas chloroacetimidivorans TaxID=1766656 RepID=UPI003C765E48
MTVTIQVLFDQSQHEIASMLRQGIPGRRLQDRGGDRGHCSAAARASQQARPPPVIVKEDVRSQIRPRL